MTNTPLKSSRWIGTKSGCEAPIISRKFYLDSLPDSSVLYITSLGFFEAYINGKKVTEYKFIPVQTDFEKRNTSDFLYPIHDEFTHRIYYYEFNVQNLLLKGENLLEIHLGNGWYHQSERNIEGDMRYGTILKAIYNLVCDGVSFSSDGSEVWCESQIRYNNLFTGEIHDKTFMDSSEKAVDVFPAPDSMLCVALGTPDKVIRTIKPTLLGTVGNKKVYDAGENISGVARVYTSGKKGEKILLNFAENINEDLTLNYASVGGSYDCRSGVKQIMSDTFICDGTVSVFEPKFTWHAFRYFEVEGPVDDLEILVIHSDCDITSSFKSSSEGLNFLYDAFIRTQLDNMHGSFPSDCPHRERLGYTGDGQLGARPAMMFLDTKEFYRKWIQDILDCQDKVSGHVQHTAPFMGGGGGPGGWGCAIVLVPFEYYKQFGEIEMLEHCFEPILKWFGYLTSRLENNLVAREEERGWCLGDWCVLEKLEMPEAFVNTYYFIKSIRIFLEIAKILGKEERVSEFKELEKALCRALKETYQGADGRFCSGANGADLFAYDIGLLDEAIMDKVAKEYEEKGCINTGIFGTPLLFEALFKKGYTDIAFSLYESEKLGSFLYMKRHGATTLWECWNGKDSHNHPMFGGCSSHLFTSILGCKQTDGSAGYKSVVIKPQLPAKLDFAEGEQTTVNGKIKIGFRRVGNKVLFDIKLAKTIEASFEFEGQDFKLKNDVKADTFEVKFETL